MLILVSSTSLFNGRELVGLLGSVSLSKTPAPQSSRKRSYQSGPNQSENDYDDVEEEEEEEEDDYGDEFEEDQRPIKRSKTATSSAPVYRRQERQMESHRPAAATSSAQAPSPAPLSSMPDFAAIQRVKALARVNSRLGQPQSLKKRFVWSDRDSATLIDLVARRAAGWSTIYKEDSHLFQLPRNAQAYRDRARNMKVDFLISDAVLPRGFDLVTLSKKEIDRLHKLGKNHARRESDVDRNGKPTNTEADLL